MSSLAPDSGNQSRGNQSRGGRDYTGRRAHRDGPTAELAEESLEEAFDRIVEEGERRLRRQWPSLIMTGVVGGVDVSFGVLAYLIVVERTGNVTLGGLAFSIGFIALTLAQSELFTEDFFVPVAAVVARRAGPGSLLRLWSVTLAANLAGGWVISWLAMVGYPELRGTAVKTASHYVHLAGTGRGFALAMMAGAVITLLTWMQHSSENLGLRLVPAVAFGALLAGGQLLHSVLDSFYAFAALHTGHAPFGYLAWLQMLGWAVLGNLVGGVGLVTVLRLAQLPHKVSAERAK
jgi:formate/nitrite transporter FocA (FNT family)